MANPSQIPGPDAPPAEVADFLALVDRLIGAVTQAQLESCRPAAARRPPLEHVGPSDVYRELEYLLGYRNPTGYRATPSGPDDRHTHAVTRLGRA